MAGDGLAECFRLFRSKSPRRDLSGSPDGIAAVGRADAWLSSLIVAAHRCAAGTLVTPARWNQTVRRTLRRHHSDA
jgi:hypothetical protein